MSINGLETSYSWRLEMKDQLLKLSIKVKNLLSREEGQDLIEYALVVALVAFAATAGMQTLANGINTAFTHIQTTLNTYIP
jgi:pilus assembly protein Flp/PilA